MKIERRLDLSALSNDLFSKDESAEGERLRMRALSKAITLVENDYRLAGEILRNAQQREAVSPCHVIGITGLPGAGKSTLTNFLIGALRKQNKRVALLAVDPSSQSSGGAFLGDRVRLGEHSKDSGVYIRSMATRGALGGVARATRGALHLVRSLAFDFAIVETVGVGQSESDILSIADTIALVLMPHSGDEIQLMKAGLLEHCHIYVINKKDLHDPSRMMTEIVENTSSHAEPGQWQPRVLATSAKTGDGLEALFQAILQHQEHLKVSGPQRKEEKSRREVFDEARYLLEEELKLAINALTPAELAKLASGKATSFELAERITKQASKAFLDKGKT